jgi:hypothetical protein
LAAAAAAAFAGDLDDIDTGVLQMHDSSFGQLVSSAFHQIVSWMLLVYST